MTPKRIQVNVAWPYANGPRHLGHVAGFGVPSDIFARYHRMAGNEVVMVSGTDEYGTPITVQAEKEGLTPHQLVDQYNAAICQDLVGLGLSYDLFTRTTTTTHHTIAQDFFTTLHQQGRIFPRKMPGAFSAVTGHTLPDRYIEGRCPHCQSMEARGDQCDACGKQLDPAELLEPRSKIDGKPPVFKESEHFFLDLPFFVQTLANWLQQCTHWRPNVRNFSLNLLQEIQARAITRDMEWGVPIPKAAGKTYESKRLYVWFDAVIGYLSASIEWAAHTGKPAAWEAFWRDENCHHYYFMGKDNIVFHAIIWPSMLHGYAKNGPLTRSKGAPFCLPYEVVASEFLTMEGKKFSSSRGVVIYVKDLLARYDADALRFYLTIAGPETQDADFTWREFIRRNNEELVATWGNLVNRCLTLAHRHFGAIPKCATISPEDTVLLKAIEQGFEDIGEHIATCRFKAAILECMRLAGETNRRMSDAAPWALVKTDKKAAATVLYAVLCAIRNLNVLFSPFLPFSAQTLHSMLGEEGELAPLPKVQETTQNGKTHRIIGGDYTSMHGRWCYQTLPQNRPLHAPKPLFKKIDPSVAEEELARLERACREE